MKRWPKSLLITLLLLITMRIALPYFVKWYVNRTLADIPGHYGKIGDVDIALWRGSYQIEDTVILKLNGKLREPYFSVEEADISIDWEALLNGTIATRIILKAPHFTLVKGNSDNTTQLEVDSKWQTQIQKLYPFKIDRLTIIDGSLSFKNNTTNPKIYVSLTKLEAEGKNFTNAQIKNSHLFATVEAQARIQRHGQLKVKMTLNPFKDPPHADYNGQITKLPLSELNDFSRAYGDFDFEKGVSSVYMEFATTDNRFVGYTKLMLEQVDVLDWNKEKGDSFTHKIWEGLIGAGFVILENQPKERFALRMPMDGQLDDIKVDDWATFISVLKNAFIEALPKKLENSFNLKSL